MVEHKHGGTMIVTVVVLSIALYGLLWLVGPRLFPGVGS
jgi:hypothetical protein